MGRGRAKAKQTKVARELKYFSPDTDLSALERELRASRSANETRQAQADDEGDEYEQGHRPGVLEGEALPSFEEGLCFAPFRPLLFGEMLG